MFDDRHDAGRRLADRLSDLDLPDPVVLALPRGGVPVGFEVARGLNADLEVLVARKIGAPFQPELGVGAVAEGGEPVLDTDTLQRLGLSERELQDTIARERAELDRRVNLYRGQRARALVAGREAIVVDDGLATGVTAGAALQAVRRQEPRRLILAVPVAAGPTAARLGEEADELVCLHVPEDFQAVGMWYRRFEQTSDDTVLELLEQSRSARSVGGRGHEA